MRVIRKYANRRLYDTEQSRYVTLEDLRSLVLAEEVFKVEDAKSGEDLTRTILLTIIIEQEQGDGEAEVFSNELNQTIAGVDDKPGLRARIEEITTDLHQLLAGGEGAASPGLNQQIDTTMRKINMLVEEMSALVIWGEYITGTLAEKPSRLIFGSKENDVPTKEQIIEHVPSSQTPYPVRIKELESGAKPQPQNNSLMPPESASPEDKKKGIMNLFKRRE